MSIGATTVFKLFLIVGLVILSIVFVYYTLDVIGQLKSDAERTANSYVKLWQLAASESTSGGEIQVIFEEVIKKANFPVVITGIDGQPLFWRNVPGIPENEQTVENIEKIKRLVVEMKSDKGEIPLKFGEQTISYFYYGNSAIIRQLQWMPFVELGLVGLFILIGFIGFQNIRRSEERHIWVGLAKETAHQLGTPISSLMGWLEILKGEIKEADNNTETGIEKSEMYSQMLIDVNRLEKIANRFGKIGSLPELKESDLNGLMEETITYFKRRLPFEGRGIQLNYNHNNIPNIKMNSELLGWSFENLIKNSLQAVDPQSGIISFDAKSSDDNKFISIQVTDNGKGIPPGMARKVFRPGFTTKKRGWGLGLTLVKRIIEEYHHGKITLLKSKPGETVFTIILPVNEKYKVRWYK